MVPDGRMVTMDQCLRRIEWSRDWQCLLFSRNNREWWKDHCCCTIWN